MWATDGLELMYLDSGYKVLRSTEIDLAQRAPVEAYVNTYLGKTIIAYKNEQTGIRMIRCSGSQAMDLE